jgi:hypothetical protein
MPDTPDPKRSGAKQRATNANQNRAGFAPNTETTADPRADDHPQASEMTATFETGRKLASTVVGLAAALERDLTARGAAMLAIREPEPAQVAEMHTLLLAIPSALSLVEARGWRLRTREIETVSGIAFAMTFCPVDVPPGVDPQAWFREEDR